MKKTDARLIEMAEQQILGYCECANGSNLSDLICSMGLTKEEWEKMQNQDDLTYMTEAQKEEIDSCFLELCRWCGKEIDEQGDICPWCGYDEDGLDEDGLDHDGNSAGLDELADNMRKDG